MAAALCGPNQWRRTVAPASKNALEGMEYEILHKGDDAAKGKNIRSSEILMPECA